MKSFLSDTPIPPVVPRKVTAAAQVQAAFSSGAWLTRKEIVALTGLGDGVVNTSIHVGIRRGLVEREHPGLGCRTRGIVQRYRLAERRQG